MFHLEISYIAELIKKPLKIAELIKKPLKK